MAEAKLSDEIAAMAAIEASLEKLDEPTRTRAECRCHVRNTVSEVLQVGVDLLRLNVAFALHNLVPVGSNQGAVSVALGSSGRVKIREVRKFAAATAIHLLARFAGGAASGTRSQCGTSGNRYAPTIRRPSKNVRKALRSAWEQKLIIGDSKGPWRLSQTGFREAEAVIRRALSASG